MRFTYDEHKSISNKKKHGFDLSCAREVIEGGATLMFEDRRFGYGEQRFQTLGFYVGCVVVIITAETSSEIRIISMRKADKNE